jgi:FkbH-like protein
MVLSKDDFVAWKINWLDKATNLQDLAKELNIGLDSMVFLDDNPSERELIRILLPMVEVPEFPDKPYELMTFYDKLVNKYFRIYSVTDEDVVKTEQYKENAKRLAVQTKFIDFNDYLRSLEIRINIIPLDEFNLPRIAQMTQKTNQFNLTTHRYTENDIKQLSKEGCLIYCIDVNDKYGDSGITGEIILRPEGKEIVSIDTFLLSCRILGRGIEFAFLDSILNKLVDKGYKTAKAKYIKSAKNSQVSDFYDRAGFSLINCTNEVRDYSLNISKREIKHYYTITIQ